MTNEYDDKINPAMSDEQFDRFAIEHSVREFEVGIPVGVDEVALVSISGHYVEFGDKDGSIRIMGLTLQGQQFIRKAFAVGRWATIEDVTPLGKLAAMADIIDEGKARIIRRQMADAADGQGTANQTSRGAVRRFDRGGNSLN